MILQALVEYYESLSKLGKIAPPGWGLVKVSYALCISDAGILEQVICLKTEQPRGKKTVLAPQEISLPAPVKRTVGILPNFLCDNSSYLLGIDAKGKPERARKCFAASKELHQKILADIDTPAAHALLAFFETWNPVQAAAHPVLQDCLEEIMAGANLIFRVHSSYVHEDPMIRDAWTRHRDTGHEGPEMVCLVTGEKGPVESIHPAIKGVKGAQSSGAALISFNAPAFCSYGKEQNLNAPVSQYAAFAYTTALNTLLADREHVLHLGDTTVVCWAKSAHPAYSNFMNCIAFGHPSLSYSDQDLLGMMRGICKGQKVEFEEELLDPNMEFYLLGLSPNAARLSVRFFLRNSFGNFLKNVEAHHERMQIIRPSYDKFETLPLWKMLDETVNQHSRNKSPAPNLAGETLRAILNNTPYPAQLLQSVNLRIRAEREITRGRAAIIKAYYLKKTHPDLPKEVLTVSLNPDSTNVPYTLGRLFSVLEAIQSDANPTIKTTIKDCYFNAASATPAHIFPTLLNLAQKHLKKLQEGLQIMYNKQLTELMGKLEDSFPAHLSIPQQGAFQLGYYHQTQERYSKKKTKEEN